jgi:hypothetical protein
LPDTTTTEKSVPTQYKKGAASERSLQAVVLPRVRFAVRSPLFRGPAGNRMALEEGDSVYNARRLGIENGNLV